MRRTAGPAREVGGKKVKQPMQRYKGLGRDGRRPARRHDDGPAPPHPAQVTMRDLEAAERDLRAAHGQRGGPAQGLHHRVRRRGRPGAHRRLRPHGPGPVGCGVDLALSAGWRTARGVTCAVPTMTVVGSEPTSRRGPWWSDHGSTGSTGSTGTHGSGAPHPTCGGPARRAASRPRIDAGWEQRGRKPSCRVTAPPHRSRAHALPRRRLSWNGRRPPSAGSRRRSPPRSSARPGCRRPC